MLTNKNFGDIVTFARASARWVFNAGGVLVQNAANVPSLDYDPISLAARGLLIEEQRTNAIRNSTMVGVVAGSPGTLPTNWNTAGLLGLTRTILGTVVEDGMTCIDIRWQGTTTDTIGAFYPDNAISAAINGQSWAVSGFMRLIAGSLSGIGVKYGLYQHSSGGAFLNTVDGPLFTVPAGGTVGQAGQGTVRVTNRADIGFVRHGTVFTYASGLAVDFTLRIGLLQLEQGGLVTSPIPTTGATATRAADSAIIADLSKIGFNPSEGTLYVEAKLAPEIGASVQILASLDDGTINNRLSIYRSAPTNNIKALARAAGVLQADLTGPVAAGAQLVKAAFAWKASDFALVVNGGAPAVGGSGALPTVNRLVLGDGSNSNSPLNGAIRFFKYVPVRETTAKMQANTL